MADERENEAAQPGTAAGKDKIQTPGRKANAAQPLDAAKDQGGPERYPAVRQDEAVERTGRADQVSGENRTFQEHPRNPEPRQGAGDSSVPHAVTEGWLGPGGDPAEGKP